MENAAFLYRIGWNAALSGLVTCSNRGAELSERGA